MQQNQFYAWLSETLTRFVSKSPVYFKVWNVILTLIAIIPQIPAVLASFNIQVPLVLAPAVAKLISAAAIGALFTSKLTVKDPTMTVTGSNLQGDTVSETIVKPSLPFTANVAATAGVAPVKEIASNIPYTAPQDSTASK